VDEAFLLRYFWTENFTLDYDGTSRHITESFLYFHGVIGDLRIYVKPLSIIEVEEIFSGKL